MHLDAECWLAEARPHPITPETTSAEFSSLMESIKRQGLQRNMTVMTYIRFIRKLGIAEDELIKGLPTPEAKGEDE